MDCKIKDFYITDIREVSYIDQKIYPNNFVQYGTHLQWDELVFFKDTYATVYFDDHIFNIEPNDILFLTSGEHKKYVLEIHRPGTFIDIFYASNIPLNSTPTLYKFSTNNTYINFQQILAIRQQNPAKNYAKCMSILWDLIYKIQTNTRLPKAQNEMIEPAIEYIENHYLDPQISVEKLATRCGISYSMFLKIFEQRFSTTPKNYIIKLKMNHACELLKTEKSITEISEALGFTDVYFFSKQFKKYMNLSPTTYRKRFLQNIELYNRVNPWEKI